MPSFIYVFDEAARDTLLSLHYELLKGDDEMKIYVFVNKENQNFAGMDIKYALTNTLTF